MNSDRSQQRTAGTNPRTCSCLNRNLTIYSRALEREYKRAGSEFLSLYTSTNRSGLIYQTFRYSRFVRNLRNTTYANRGSQNEGPYHVYRWAFKTVFLLYSEFRFSEFFL